MVIFYGETWSILQTAWLNYSQGAGHTIEGEVVRVKYSSWKECKCVVISRSSYQPVGQQQCVNRNLHVKQTEKTTTIHVK